MWRILTWSHYKRLLQVTNVDARAWYLQEAAEQIWSYRTLDRNIGSQYYERLLLSQRKETVKSEMEALTAPFEHDRMEFIKNPTVAEFIGLAPNSDFTESDLEKAIIGNLKKFLHHNLKSFVLIDLKTTTITHQDVGQMDMYVRMYDERVRGEGDNPTIGIVLCSETDEDIARYSVLHDNDRLFASKYMLYMPTEKELREEIERQKEFYRLQHETDKPQEL